MRGRDTHWSGGTERKELSQTGKDPRCLSVFAPTLQVDKDGPCVEPKGRVTLKATCPATAKQGRQMWQ